MENAPTFIDDAPASSKASRLARAGIVFVLTLLGASAVRADIASAPAGVYIESKDKFQTGKRFAVSSATIVDLYTTTIHFRDGSTSTSTISAGGMPDPFTVSSGTVRILQASTITLPSNGYIAQEYYYDVNGTPTYYKQGVFQSLPVRDSLYIGAFAGNWQTSSATYNTAVGQGALQLNTTGFFNVAVGNGALLTMSGVGNVAVGVSALDGLYTTGAIKVYGSSNTAVGTLAGAGAYQVVTSSSVTQGTKNTFLGFNANQGTVQQLNNATAIGADARVYSSDTMVLGNHAKVIMSTNVLAGQTTNYYDGTFAGATLIKFANGTQLYAPGALNSVYLGNGTVGNGTAQYATCMGYNSCTGAANSDIGIGFYALTGTAGTGGNIAIGPQALGQSSFRIGTNNVAIGNGAMDDQDYAGFDSVAIGHNAFQHNNNYGETTAVGAYALQNSSTGWENVGVGVNALQGLVGGFGNTAVGAHALITSTGGVANTGVGYTAGGSPVSPSQQMNPMSSGMTFLGAGSRVVSSQTVINNATAIGYLDTVGCSNCITMGADAAGSAYFVGVGTTTPVYNFAVVGGSGTYFGGDVRVVNTLSASSITVAAIKLTGLTSQGCIGTDGSGIVIAGTCSGGGGGGGGGALETLVGVRVTSPTLSISFNSSQFTGTATTASTATIAMNASSVTLQGNTFNAANKLLQLDSSGLVPTAQLPSTVATTNTNQTISGVKTFSSSVTVTSPSGANVTYGLIAGSVTATNVQVTSNTTIGPITFYQDGSVAYGGSGDGGFIFTIGNSTYSAVYSSGPMTVGNCAVWTSTSGALSAIPCGSGGGGSGTVNSGAAQQIAYYAAAGSAVSGSSVIKITASSATVVGSSFSISNDGNLNTVGGDSFVNFFYNGAFAGQKLMCVGSQSQHNQFCVPNAQPVKMDTYGAQAGQLVIGDASNVQRIYSIGDPNNFIDYRTLSNMTLNTGNANGPGDVRIRPVGTEVAVFASTGTMLGGVNGVNVRFGLTAGSVTVSNLTASQYVKTDSNKQLATQSGVPTTDLTGTLQSGQVPAFTGDATNSAGSLTMSLAAIQGNVRTFSSSITVNGAGGVYTQYGQSVGSITLRNVASGTQCLHADASGNVTGTGSDCGAGGGGETNTYTSSKTFTGGVYASSPIINGINSDVITTTMTLSSSMTVVSASCTATNTTNKWITLTLPPLSSVRSGHPAKIYDVGADSCSIRVAANPADTIISTGAIMLNAKFHTATLEAVGTVGWAGQWVPTPYSVATTQDEVGTYSMSASSVVYQCPVYIPAPFALLGFRADRVGGTGNISLGLFDQQGKFLVGTSTQTTISGPSNYLLSQPTAAVYQGAPGWYKVAVQMNHTGLTLSGSNSMNDVTMMCSEGATPSNLDISKVTLTTGGTRNRNVPSIYLLLNGGQLAN